MFEIVLSSFENVPSDPMEFLNRLERGGPVYLDRRALIRRAMPHSVTLRLDQQLPDSP